MSRTVVNAGGSRSQDGDRRARRLEPWWIAGNLAYSGLRIALAYRLLSRHGLNVWAFTLVELVASIPWAISTSRLTKGLLTRTYRNLWLWFIVAGASFFAPDIFVLATTHDVPAWIYAGIAAWLSTSAALAARRIAVSARDRRAAGA